LPPQTRRFGTNAARLGARPRDKHTPTMREEADSLARDGNRGARGSGVRLPGGLHHVPEVTSLVQGVRPSTPVPQLPTGSAAQHGGTQMSRPEQLAVKIGDELLLQEADYCYGAGPLLLRVTAVHEVQRFDGDAWLRVRGMQLRRSDKLQLCERVALVRLAALPACVSPREGSS
jgi:hypothetical protein